MNPRNALRKVLFKVIEETYGKPESIVKSAVLREAIIMILMVDEIDNALSQRNIELIMERWTDYYQEVRK